jgi:hypothetical protein
MATFCAKNVHPHKLFVGDCVKRAIVVAANMDYTVVARELNLHKKISGVKCFNDYPNPDQYVEKIGAKSIYLPKVQMTVSEFVDFVASVKENAGLIVGVWAHWTAALIENGQGTVYDTWNCMNEIVTEAWIFEKGEKRDV